MSKDYCINLFNKSDVQATETRGVHVMVCTLPSGFTITKVGSSFLYCKEEIIKKIYNYEKYMELDKKYYGYDLEEEFINE